MQFTDFAKYLQKLEETPKRLEITAILLELLKELRDGETREGVFMSLGYLQAPFEAQKFNMADKMMLRALALAYDTDITDIATDYGKTGDLGEVAASLCIHKTSSDLTVKEIHSKLTKIAKLGGTGSQETKVGELAGLLKQLDRLSAKYIVRIVLGTTRLGFTELTVIDALAWLLADDLSDKKAIKVIKSRIEEKYNVHPDIGLIAEKLKQEGIKGLNDIGIEVGVPILPQKAQRLPAFSEVMEKMGTVWAEYKFDGTRVQLHFDRSRTIQTSDIEQQNLFDVPEERVFIKTYTRNLEEVTYQYPDIVEAAEKQIDADSVILDGEAIGYSRDTGAFLPFQEIMQRKRKHDVKAMALEVPLKYFVFDILYLNGESLTKKPLHERKKLLKKVIRTGDAVIVDEHVEISTLDELVEYFENARGKGLEGLIVKNPNAEYRAGARSYNWVKLKVADAKLLDDTVETVVLGYYFGRGERANFGIGGFLAGVYDKEEGVFKSITRVGTGLSDEDWVYLKAAADKLEVKEKPKNVILGKANTPDVWTAPELVVELGADEITRSAVHTTGFALRFPRLIKFRTDKLPEDITTLEEIKDLYKMQKRGYY